MEAVYIQNYVAQQPVTALANKAINIKPQHSDFIINGDLNLYCSAVNNNLPLLLFAKYAV